MNMGQPIAIPGLGGTMSNSAPPTRNSSMVGLSGSHFGSVMSSRPRKSLTLQMNPSPLTEKKLNRTRRMSEAVRSPESVRGKTPRLMRIPTEMTDISKDWVRLVVNQYLLKLDKEILLKENQIEELNVQDCKSGSGDYSCTCRLDVKVRGTKGDSEHYSFIAKLLPSEDAGRVYVFEANLLEKEIEMYFEVLPSLKLFLRGQAYGNKSAIIEECVPECVYGSHNLDGAGVLVFSSCLKRGFEHCADPDGLTADELMLTIQKLAQFHAAGRVFLADKTEELVRRRYPSLTKDMYSNGMLLDSFNQNLQTYSDLLQTAPCDELGEAKDNFEKLRQHGVWDMLLGLKRRGPQSLTTIIHGEMWERNILFNTSEGKCLFLDWKNAKIASPMLDVAFLLFSSSNIQMISTEGQHKVLKAYHQSFCASLKYLLPKCRAPTFQDVFDDFQLTVRDALMQSICLFVQEMEYIENSITQNGAQNVDLLKKMQSYEKRAMHLLQGIDFEALPKEDDSDEGDEDDSDAMSRYHRESSTGCFGDHSQGFAIGLGDDGEDEEASGYISV